VTVFVPNPSAINIHDAFQLDAKNRDTSREIAVGGSDLVRGMW